MTLRTGKPCSNVVMGVHKPDGALTWISINSQPLFSGDKTSLVGVAASFSDITDRKKIEETLAETAAQLRRADEKLKQMTSSRP